MDYTVETVDCPERIDCRAIEDIALKTLAAIKAEAGQLTIAFFDDEQMRELNRQFRGKDYATDVLSFPVESQDDEEIRYFGDIAIAVPVAEEQAQEYGHSLLTELQQLTLHGILHLVGYDHETDRGEMDALELQLRDSFFPKANE